MRVFVPRDTTAIALGAEQVVAALQVEFKQIENDIAVLIQEMRKAIATSDAFIESMQ